MLPLLDATVARVYRSPRMWPFSSYTLKMNSRGISYPDREDAKRAAQRMAASHDSSPVHCASVILIASRSSSSDGSSSAPAGTLFFCNRKAEMSA